MYKGLNLVFEYVIRFDDGSYYTGNAGKTMHGKKNEAFKYTEFGAYAKIDRLKHSPYFSTATVEKVL